MDTLKWQRILAATDFSDYGNRAVAEAHALAEKFEAELHVLHVVDNVDKVAERHGTTGTLEPDEVADGPKAWLAELLGETGTVRRVDAVQFGNDVAEKIVNYARTKAIDVIVLASHGRTGLARMWLGSVAEKVIRAAPCPVLVLRATAEKPVPVAAV